jgi:exoribonuclease R
MENNPPTNTENITSQTNYHYGSLNEPRSEANSPNTKHNSARKNLESEYPQHREYMTNRLHLVQHRNNAVPYYGRSVNKKIPKNYHTTLISTFKRKRNVASTGYTRKGLKKLIFINSYDKCNDFSNYKNFVNLNLKFLKQNYKFKDNEMEEASMLKRAQNQFFQMQQNFNTTAMPGITNNNNNNNPMNNYLNLMNMANLQKQMSIYNAMSMNNNNPMSNLFNNPFQGGMNNNNPIMNTNPGTASINSNNNNNINPNSNVVNNINIYQMNNYNNFIQNNINVQNPLSQMNKAGFKEDSNDNLINYNMLYNKNYTGDNTQMLYYESLRLQPYTFVKDQSVIDENLKSGRYLKGVIRINRCHTHGYITVSGLVNDILIRGNRNLNQSLHLDEVVVELFPMVCWKPLFNKKIRKISLQTEMKREEQVYYNTEVEAEDKHEDKDEDELESNNGTNFKEDFDTLEERLAYVNKVYNLRPEGRIVQIASSPNIEKPQIVTITHDKSLIFACPIDENLPKIFIKMKKFRRVEFIKKLENDKEFKNKYFLVKIVGWALNFKGPKGIIVNELGNCGDIEVETEVLLRSYEVHYGQEYPHQAMEELKDIESNYLLIKEFQVDDEMLKKRADLRKDIIFTIDPEHSKDLDDAISVKVINEETGLLEIGVHIADPSHFVPKDSLLDKEALERITTVYLVHKNIPMLPRVLSENLCSLLPYQDRLSISCVFRIFLNTGALDNETPPRFFLSIINSTAKWNYDLVQEILDGKDIKYEDLSAEKGTKPLTEDIFNTMVANVKVLNKLTKLVRSQRIQSGSLIIENEELAFTLASDNTPIGFKIKSKKDSNNLIEELMLIANKLCAEYLYENIKEHCLVRKHPFLNDSKFQEIQRYLTANKLIVDFEDPQELNEMLFKLKNTNLNKYIVI